MRIVQSEEYDVPEIFIFYDLAIEYQKQKFGKHWLPFDEYLVKKEISEKRQWKIMEGNTIACIFAIAYEDPYIWGERNVDPAMYIHRIVTNPVFRGGHYVKKIVTWAIDHCTERHLQFIRMDTWGDNETLIKYYQECGFDFIGTVSPRETDELPKHYSNIILSLFEIKIN